MPYLSGALHNEKLTNSSFFKVILRLRLSTKLPIFYLKDYIVYRLSFGYYGNTQYDKEKNCVL